MFVSKAKLVPFHIKKQLTQEELCEEQCTFLPNYVDHVMKTSSTSEKDMVYAFDLSKLYGICQSLYQIISILVPNAKLYVLSSYDFPKAGTKSIKVKEIDVIKDFIKKSYTENVANRLIPTIHVIAKIINELHKNAKMPSLNNETLKVLSKPMQEKCIKDLIDIIKKFFPRIPLPQKDEQDKIIPLGVLASGAEQMWAQGYNGKNILVGVIDTGIMEHPDLDGKVIIRRVYTGESGPPKNIHGTHVAGTIAANGKLRGIAYGAQLADYRVLNANGEGSYDWITKAIRQAVDDGCHIINMSLGGPLDDPIMRLAIDYAHKKGVIVCVASGNEGDGNHHTDEFSYPAMYPNVISVGAAKYNGNETTPCKFTNSNHEVDCCAHGDNVISTCENGKYLSMSGTSMACPHISAVAALIIEKGVDGDISTAVHREIKNLAKDIYVPGRDNATGFGFVTFNNTL